MNYYDKIKQQFIDNKAYHEVKDYSKNKKDLETYYNVGKLIIEAQGGEERAKYGNKLIKEYSKKLTEELGKGYSERQLRDTRQFYLLFKNEKWRPLVAKLTWSHICKLLPIKDRNKRNYYINECINNNVSKRELQTKIKNKEYERLEFKNKNNIEINENINNIAELIKNPIIIPNTSNYEIINEKRLKYLILDNLDYFLKELGNGFTYIGNEYKIKIDDRFFYIDILLYNIKHNCYVVVELKINEFKKEYISQVRMYMNYIDKNIKDINQNKTIGIIICKKENRFVLEYVSDPSIFITKFITV